MIRAIARHSEQLAHKVVDAGVLPCLVHCLEEFDPAVKESAAWAIGQISRHSVDLAQSCVDVGVIPLLGLCVQEPEMALKRIAASSLADIASHTASLAMCVVDAHILPQLCVQVSSPQQALGDPKLIRQVVRCLSAVAKHNIELAEYVIDGDVFPGLWACFKSTDVLLKKASAELVANIVKHSAELSQLVSHSGGCAVLLDYINTVDNQSTPGATLSGLLAVGYMASLNDTLAMSVIKAKGVETLSKCLEQSPSDVATKATACWALGQIGKHGSEHAKHLTDLSILLQLLSEVKRTEADNSEQNADLHAKAKKALKSILSNSLDSTALDPLLQTTTPPNILKYVLAQYAKILPQNVAARRVFVTTGGLARVEEIAALYAIGPVSSLSKDSDPNTVKSFESSAHTNAQLSDSIRSINESFPEEIVRYYSPGYANTLLTKIDEQAAMATISAVTLAGKNKSASPTLASITNVKSSLTKMSALPNNEELVAATTTIQK